MKDLNLVLADIEVRLLESASAGTVYGVVATHPKTGKRDVMASGFASKRAAALDVRMLERKGYEDIEIVSVDDEDMPIEESSGKDVAMTIIKQMGGMGRLKAMVGAKDFVSYSAASESKYGEGLGGVAFKFAKSKGKPNYVKIILDPSDTYTVTFGSIRGYQLKDEDEISGVYVSNLRDLFERKTGLYLSL
jgi:hypothetical protein